MLVWTRRSRVNEKNGVDHNRKAPQRFCLHYSAFSCKIMSNLGTPMHKQPSGCLLLHSNSLANLSLSRIGNEVQGRMAGRCSVTFMPSMLTVIYL